jgi:peptidoglycan/LPS O-acetylase OafA/YrhL/lysophospholipase L1-like esterase
VGRARPIREAAPAPSTPAPQDRTEAWDGLRGLAVAAVLVYHVEGHPLSGGFLGVSLFFTLSGFLITGIVADGLARTGGFDAAHFWSRRFRRLVPAFVAAIVLVLAFGHLASSANQRANLAGDAVSSLLSWSNWRFLLTGQEYGGTVVDPSPLLHTWSLSIEVQVYLVLPLLVALGWRRRGAAGATAVVAAVLAACTVTGAVVAADTQQWYLGTHVRAQEILVGALGALAVRTHARARIERWSAALVPFAVGVIGAMWWVADEGDRWLPRGGLLLHAVLTTALVVTVRRPGRLFGRVLSSAPLAGLGRISYGVYLYHWPLYLWLDPRRLGLDRWPTTAVRVAVALALATVSYRWLERPVLAGASRRPSRAVLAGSLSLAATALVAAVVAPTADRGERIDVRAGLVVPPSLGPGGPAPSGVPPSAPATSGADEGPTSGGGTSAPGAGTTASTAPPTTAVSTPEDHVSPALVPAPPADHVPRILIVGDSAVNTFGPGVQAWASFLGIAEVYAHGWLACPVTVGGSIRWNDGLVAEIPDYCDRPELRRQELEELRPDLVVIYTGMWEVVDRKLPGSDEWVHIGDPVMDAEIERQLAAFTDLHRTTGTRVLWVLQPPVRNSIYARLPGPLVEEDPARMERLNQIIRGIAETRANVWTLDMPAVFTDLYGDPYALQNRTDGFHWSVAGAERDGAWLAPLLAAVAGQPLSA